MSPVCLALGVLFVRPHNDQTRSDVSCPDAKISRLNSWPAGSPVNASSRTSRCATHDSGPVWFAIPSLLETFTLYSLSISRRTSVHFFTNGGVTPIPQLCFTRARFPTKRVPTPLRRHNVYYDA